MSLSLVLTNGIKEAFVNISSDSLASELVMLCRLELFEDAPESDLIIRKDGKPIVFNASHANQTLASLNIENNDILFVTPMPSADATSKLLADFAAALAAQKANPAAASPAVQGSPSTSGTMDSRLQDLIKSIKVPGAAAADPLRQQALLLFNRLKADTTTTTKAQLYHKCKEVLDVYEKDPSNQEGFVTAFKKWVEEEQRKQRLMDDPTSEEGQRLIQEAIKQNNIDYQYSQVLEHTPEAFVAVHMLYIRMDINGHPVKAFVDSGAQVSIISEDCARRCGLDRLIDTRFTGVARGVGGTQKFVGRIHACQVKIENHFFNCNFDVLSDRSTDLLFGLNILKRHHCNINLKLNQLEMGDGTITPFLGEADIPKNEDVEMEAVSEQSSSTAPEVNAEMLANLVGMGFSSDQAKQALTATKNNLSEAVDYLYAKANSN